MARKYSVFLATFIAWLFIDQATKLWTINALDVGSGQYHVFPGLLRSMPETPEDNPLFGLSFVHAQNFGAAFSSMEGQFWLFIVFTAVATIVVTDLMRRMRPDDGFTAGTLAMILSGAWGNGIDRIRIGHVTDFIRVYTDDPSLKAWFIERFGTNTWPIFNVADSVLLVGVTLFLVHYLFLEEEEVTGEEKSLEDLTT